MGTAMDKEMLIFDDISKSFNNKKILNKINLAFKPGEITCLLGKNGAGKTVLMSILMGIVRPDSGEIRLNDRILHIASPSAAYSLGFNMVFQESMLIPNLSVAENVFINLDPDGCENSPLVSIKSMNRKAAALFDSIGFSVKVRQKVGNLTFAQKQIVSIVKALAPNPKVLILDEPSTSLVEEDMKKVFAVLNRLKEQGTVIIYISHHLSEVLRIADRIVILRDSSVIGIHDEKEKFDFNQLLLEMTGEELTNRYPRIRTYKGETAMSVEKVNVTDLLTDIHFSINEGEIVGVFGLEGSGKEYLGKVLYGLQSTDYNRTLLHGNPVSVRTPQEALKAGIAYLGEEFVDNLFMNNDISFNITLSNLDNVSTAFYLQKKKCKATARYFIDKFKINTSNAADKIAFLSGGAKQKVAISKCLFSDSSFIILENVSKYLDIPSKVELYNILNKLAGNGISIIFISSDVEELIGMCDRILIFYKGSIIRELEAEKTSSAEILVLASEGTDINLRKVSK